MSECLPESTSAKAIQQVTLGEVSTVPVPSLPESIGPPLMCDSDGRIVFRLVMPDTGMEDPLSLSRDGKTITRFGREKINDVQQPGLLTSFLSGSDVYILTRGTVQLGNSTKLRKPSGEEITQPATKSNMFVAHFESDGRYAGAVPLDVPFRSQQLGVFDNGDFLIGGIDKSRTQPQLAIVAPNGQVRRLVELKGDVHAQEEPDSSRREKDPTALPLHGSTEGLADSLFDVVSNSRMVKYGSELLLFRPANSPVFSVSPSGEVRVHKLKVEGSYRLFAIKPAANSWIVQFIRQIPNSPEMEFATYGFGPETGLPLKEYFFPRDMGWGLACADETEFTFVMADSKGEALQLITLAPAGGSK